MLAIFRDPWLEDRETRQREQRAKLLGEIGILGAGFTALFLVLSQTPLHTIGIGGLILMAAAAAGAGLGFL
ncbi:hypothetical protein ABID21_000990 [Pseudorhizobium tarimense]|uniref:Uncharacterized protein n=1 Tax=Pseudorhizobium tarimense TaxID=1079109 RepID=A0ABV2H368_9HYPH|nr:hypothetical protein [Pseudorhizobium tarimense]MCJ8518116.1 hypothetical protein [Pseudorhizobium tarimense]